MSKIGGIRFESQHELLDAVKNEIMDQGLFILTITEHDWHYILEIGNGQEKIGRVKFYYNQKFQCKNASILDPIKRNYYQILTDIFPIQKANIEQTNPIKDFLENNYQFIVTIIHQISDNFACYEIHDLNKNVWVIISREGPVSCNYVKGDFDFFDEVQYIIETEILEMNIS
ncbi:hypothetical protein [Niallia sp. MER TA 168]|uniref:hypothetical protein n=1 Tax=Niallia sp. MER TA 168 TaxID=2939568 RepID=UPI00203DAA19|nr:hypothetical protein [Niallia sp. MER TA 168]MCM3364891.1 hypothetical protein [Niallia sp. MER TA 168]